MHIHPVSRLFVPALLGAACAFGQGGLARITGTVTDPTHAIVNSARVTVRNTETNVSIETLTNQAGAYYVPALQPGPYELAVEKQGFRRQVVANINLTVNLTATFDVTLEVGAVSQSVEVQASSVQLEMQSAGLGKVVEQRRLEELPLAGRNALVLASLAPGVIPVRGALLGSAAEGTKIAGGLAPMNGILTDGINTKGSTDGSGSYTLPIESIQEFRIETVNYSAEYGNAAGGIANTVTKSGTNTLHGSAFDFLQNDAFNANSWGNNRNRVAKGKVRFNRFGGTLGGPLRKDKTFYFFAYEGTRSPGAANVLATVPTAAQTQGDFTQTFDGNGNRVTVYDPLTTRANPAAAGQYIRDAFPGNRIPAGRIHPISKNVLPYWPEPNRPGEGPAGVNNYFAAGAQSTRTNNYFGRVNHTLNSTHRLYGRLGSYNYNSGRTSGQFSPGFPASQVHNPQPAKSALIAVDSNFTPSLLGELRAGYTRLSIGKVPQELGFDVAKLGFPAGVLNMVTVKEFPQIDVADVASLGQSSGSGLWDIHSDSWTGQYHFTVVQGRHTLKFGADMQLARVNTYGGNVAPAGQYGFNRVYTQGPDPSRATTMSGYGVASFLLGVPASGALTVNPPALMLNRKYYNAYFQDDWRITDRLSVNLGVRYEYTTPWAEKFGQIGYYDPDSPQPDTGVKGVYKFMTPGGYQSDPEYFRFQPRLGLAYRFRDKTVVRLGGSIIHGFNNGVSYTVGDFGTGILVNTPVDLGPANPIPFTPPAGGSWSNPFASGFNIPSRDKDFVGSGVYTEFRSRKLAYISTWNLNIQRMVTPTLLVEAAYVGSKGTRIYWNRNRNQNDPILLPLGSRLATQVPNPFFGKIKSGSLSYPTISMAQALRPFPHYLDVTMFRDGYGDSSYQSAAFRIEKRYSKGFTLSVAYTISKMINSSPETQAFAVGGTNALYDTRYNRSVNWNDIPQRLVLSHIWDLPFGKGQPWLQTGLLSRVIGGWQVNGITIFQSGTPLAITAPNQTGLLGWQYGRANRLKNPVLTSGQSLDRFFDTRAFETAAPFTVPTDSITQPNLRTLGRRNFDMSFIKNVYLWERVRLQIRGEIFNLFNTPAMSAPAVAVNSVLFGQITGGGGQRTSQLALRLVF